MASLSEGQRGWIVLVAAVFAVLLTARLGWWQLDRAAQKIELQQAIDARMAEPPLPATALARSADEAAAQHHRQVHLVGRWSHAHSVWLENRQMDGRPGFFLVTPLLLADGSAVLIQRGWAPRDPRDRTRVPAVAQPDATVEVHGRIAPPPDRLFDFGDPGRGSIRQNLDVVAYAQETGLELRSLSIKQLGDASDGLRREWPQVAVDVHKHYGYAFQWFALCALITGLYVWFRIVQPRRRR